MARYTSITFAQRCREAGVTLSMGSVGDCHDTALWESFFATLACELIERSVFRTRDEAHLAVFDFTRRPRIACGEHSNSRDSSSALRPVCANSTICRRYSGA